MEDIILVDEKDNQIGTGEKLKVHLEGRLHRAFSILIFNSKGEMLLQRRAETSYHSPGLWSNTCCSHPRPGHDIKKEVERRLKEEMGIECSMKEAFSFVYQANLGELTEYEFDHVFVGKFEGNPEPNPEEVGDWKWVNIDSLREDTEKNPADYTPWLKIIIEKISFPLDFRFRQV